MMEALSGGQIFDGQSIINDCAVLIEYDKIVSVIPISDIPQAAKVIDLEGSLLAPGFIDIQVNGGGGVMLNDKPDVDTLKTIAESHRQFGTTAMLPTLISDDFLTMRATADVISKARKQKIPGIIGVHFEGPYLNIKRKGVHDPLKIRPFEDQAKALYCEPDLGVVIATLAPENCPEGLIRELSESGVRVFAGHTAANYKEIKHAITEGLIGFTHLFNAMTPMESRAPGVVGAALEDAETWCGLIVDGIHVHPATLKVAISAKQAGKMVLVTDAMPTVGAVEQTFTIRGETITAIDGVCATAEGTLSGSDLNMASAVRNTVELLGQPIEEALRMASLYPAELLGLSSNVGQIKTGFQADLVLLDNALRVKRTWIAGQVQFH
jgi:N-acetylglucosamine-6-phosphate deacetylase